MVGRKLPILRPSGEDHRGAGGGGHMGAKIFGTRFGGSWRRLRLMKTVKQVLTRAGV